MPESSYFPGFRDESLIVTIPAIEVPPPTIYQSTQPFTTDYLYNPNSNNNNNENNSLLGNQLPLLNPIEMITNFENTIMPIDKTNNNNNTHMQINNLQFSMPPPPEIDIANSMNVNSIHSMQSIMPEFQNNNNMSQTYISTVPLPLSIDQTQPFPQQKQQ